MGFGSNSLFLLLAVGLMVTLTTNSQGDLLKEIGEQTLNFLSPAEIVLTAGGVIAVAASVVFPNPFTLFAGFGLFALGLAKFPQEVFTSLGFPAEIVTFLYYAFVVGLTFALMSWQKQTGEL